MGRQSKSLLRVGELEIAVTRKAMKYIRLKVTPPCGDVVVSAPHRVSNREIAAMVNERLSWIHRERAEFQRLAHVASPNYESDEMHPLWGKPYKLRLQVAAGRRRTCLTNQDEIVLYVKPDDDTSRRACQLEDFYRAQLSQALQPLLPAWQQRTQRQVNFLGIKRMKTRWGSCNISRARIWLNLELAKHPIECLEYVLVHELVHLYERGHGAKFRALMDAYLPTWRRWHDYLNRK